MKLWARDRCLVFLTHSVVATSARQIPTLACPAIPHSRLRPFIFMHYFSLGTATHTALLVSYANRHLVNIAETQKLNNCMAGAKFCR